MNTFFYEKCRAAFEARGLRTKESTWSKAAAFVKKKKLKYSILDCELIFVPINENGNHWVLGVINMLARSVRMMDCLYGGSGDQRTRAVAYMVRKTSTPLHRLLHSF